MKFLVVYSEIRNKTITQRFLVFLRVSRVLRTNKTHLSLSMKNLVTCQCHLDCISTINELQISLTVNWLLPFHSQPSLASHQNTFCNRSLFMGWAVCVAYCRVPLAKRHRNLELQLGHGCRLHLLTFCLCYPVYRGGLNSGRSSEYLSTKHKAQIRSESRDGGRL